MRILMGCIDMCRDNLIFIARAVCSPPLCDMNIFYSSSLQLKLFRLIFIAQVLSSPTVYGFQVFYICIKNVYAVVRS